MSMHKSLRSRAGLMRARNVLSREERIEKLKEDEDWSEEESVFGLPKVKVEAIALRRKAAEEETEEEEAETTATDEAAGEEV